MRTTSFRSLVVVLIITSWGLGGCAELARSTPSLRVEASATRRRSATEEREGDQWSWGFGVQLGGAFGASPPIARVPRRRDFAARPGAGCRAVALCEWEARARARALERARLLLDAEARR